ncbi:MAG: hypothetical protein GJU76_04905 [Gallionella sp.]|nr:hypothetical protein [Gallionella sp.]
MTAAHTWNFFRAGGFDQVQLDSGADLLALNELDQKLWVALSCPTRGIEFDSQTLDMIDSDGDGRVRANEVLAAVKWAGSLLKNADVLLRGTDKLALHDIDDSSEEGKYLLASARHILKSLGKPEALEISLADMNDIGKFVAALAFNGDGVIAAQQITDAAVRATVTDAMRCVGSVADLSGEIGINADLNEQFFTELRAYADWYARGSADKSVLLLGENTEAAADAFDAVRDKLDDFFTRCQLAAYDARAAEPLSRSIADYQQFAAQNLSAHNQEVANFPLATIAANKPLPLRAGINPVWSARIEALRAQVLLPLLGEKDSLTVDEWGTVGERFAAFAAWQSERPATRVDQLGIARVNEILSSSHQSEITDLIAQDKSVEGEVKAIRSVERLLRYHRDLYTLVNNFVSFRHFYTGKDKAIFQVGTLFLDGRSCELCVWVEDVAKHAVFANMGGVCLAYCECTRRGGQEKMTIAAAFTAGDADFLMVGRNGIFYDRTGRDWDANIVRIIDHPISISQAFWSPYKKAVKMVSEQIQKLAASKASAVDDKMLGTAVEHGKAVAAPATAPKPAFDVGKFAGIFAAIGLAIGAIGGILASVVTGLLGLKIWQIPLALIGLMLLVSTPAVILAWFKLKNRNLAPILDANGWAINARAKINIPFGTSLTGLANLPAGAHRSLVDPFAEKKSLWPFYIIIALGACSVGVLWYYGFFGHRNP